MITVGFFWNVAAMAVDRHVLLDGGEHLQRVAHHDVELARRRGAAGR